MIELQATYIFFLALIWIASYLIGSIPTAVLAGKWLQGIDIREHGSGNAGATNAMRVLGPKIGFGVLFIDALKGVGAVSLALLVKNVFLDLNAFVIYQLLLGAAAIVGHVLPVFASFKGGKGVATLVGIILIMLPEVFLICLGIFLLVFFTSKYVSLASITAGISLPVVAFLMYDNILLPKLIFAVAVALFVPITHKNNIKRLLRGEENQINFKKNKYS